MSERSKSRPYNHTWMVRTKSQSYETFVSGHVINSNF